MEQLAPPRPWRTLIPTVARYRQFPVRRRALNLISRADVGHAARSRIGSPYYKTCADVSASFFGVGGPTVDVGIVLRNMGDLSTPAVIRRAAMTAETAGLDSVWVTDHIAIPPDDAEGSNGRYLDPLATLAFLAAATTKVTLGTSVLILPYRPALPTAKWVATVQELSEGRLALGVGVGWMGAEFRALGLDRRQRGKDSDRTLDLINRCFASDEVSENGQTFLFRPRPARPPIYIGGRGPHALARAVEFADGWLPGRMSPEELVPEITQLNDLAAAAGKPRPKVVLMTSLPVGSPSEAAETLAAYAHVGVDGVIHGARVDSETAYIESIEQLAAIARPSD